MTPTPPTPPPRATGRRFWPGHQLSKKDDADKLSASIYVRLTADEKAAVERAAAARYPRLKRNVSRWARETLLREVESAESSESSNNLQPPNQLK